MPTEPSSEEAGKDFKATVRIRYGFNHAPGTFEWSLPPTCRCGWLKMAFDEGGIFVANMVDSASDGELYNMCYSYIVTADGDFVSADKGSPMRYCPSCGDPVRVRKEGWS